MTMSKRIEVGENRLSVSEAREYMTEVLDIVEWGVRSDTIRTYQRRYAGTVCEEGICVEYEDDETGRTMTANVHYYVQGEDWACLRFGRDEGKPGYAGSDLPFYGTAEDAADFLTGWLAERWRESEDDYFRLTDEQKHDGYIPHELGVSARRRMAERLREAARRYAEERARRERERECKNMKAAKAVAKAAKIRKAV